MSGKVVLCLVLSCLSTSAFCSIRPSPVKDNPTHCPQLLIRGFTTPLSDEKPPFTFAKGVVPHGRATFLVENPNATPVNIQELEIVFDREKLKKNDTDAVGIRYRGITHWLEAPTDLFSPLVRFIDRDTFILYTIPPEYDANYFLSNRLVHIPGTPGFIAEEFRNTRFESFFHHLDLGAETEPLDDSNKQKILANVNSPTDVFSRPGSFVNADFDINYQAFLTTNKAGKKVTDVAGLPLRYHFNFAESGAAIVWDVELFKYPKELSGLQYDAVVFFQTAAILRQFKKDNPPEFQRLLSVFRSN